MPAVTFWTEVLYVKAFIINKGKNFVKYWNANNIKVYWSFQSNACSTLEGFHASLPLNSAAQALQISFIIDRDFRYSQHVTSAKKDSFSALLHHLKPPHESFHCLTSSYLTSA
jgi:hypothetical protein